METSASDNVVIQSKSDSDINLNTNGKEASSDMENSNNVGSETAPESENENVISDNGKEIEMAATMKCIEEANESDEISENDKIKCDLKEECDKVSCPYCDFIFEEFTSDIFRDHLQSVHNINKSLDILVEFSLKSINRGNCIST